MLARRIDPQEAVRAAPYQTGPATGRREGRTEGRWRTRGRVPTRGPAGPVHWWERPAPDEDAMRWEAVCRVQQRRLALGLSVMDVVRRLRASGQPLRRETLSRILNGGQPTTWQRVEALADLLDVDLTDLRVDRLRRSGRAERRARGDGPAL